MAIPLKQGTTVIMVGPFLKTSNGYTRSNTQTLSTAKVKLSKNDAALANKACTKASCVSTHGMYRVFLSTVDSGTLGRLKVSVAATACLPVWQDYIVLPAVPYNSLIAGSDYLTVDLVQNNGAATTVSKLTSAKLDAALVDFVGTTEWNDAIGDLSTIATADIDGGLAAFVGSTEWNDAIGGLSTLSTADLDTAISAAGLSTLSTADLDGALTQYAAATTGDLDDITTRLPAALTTDGNIKADALKVNGATPQKSTDIADVILSTPANLLLTDTQGKVSITTAARAEPAQGAPAVNADLAKKIDYLYKSWRNKKTQDSSTWSLYNDAGAVVDHKATISDDGTTATFGEIGSGA